MDNKQKKKLFKLIYKTIIAIILVSVCFGVYFAINIYKRAEQYNYVGIILIILLFFSLLTTLIDCNKTNKIKNKYKLALLMYSLILMSLLTNVLTIAVLMANKIIIVSDLFICIALLGVAQIYMIINFIIGNHLSKLYKNITITIDSSCETPNYNDELNLRKKLDELNRKLEIKKVQEQINKAQKELDGE